MQRLRKTVLGMFLSGFAACVGACIFIHLYYYSTLPSTPDEKVGRIFKMEVNHGFVRYGSDGELRTFHAIDVVLPIGGFLFLAALFLGLKWGIIQVRK